METEPLRIFVMLIYAFVLGCLCGGLHDLHRIIRAILGVRYGRIRLVGLYSRRIPIADLTVGEIMLRPSGRAFELFRNVVIFFQDLLLFSVGGAGAAILNYYFNYGRLRIYAPVAVVLGFLAYYFTVGRIFTYMSSALALVFRVTVVFSVALICTPILKTWKKMAQMCKKICENAKKALAKKQKIVYNNNKMQMISESFRRGYLSEKK